MLEHYLDTWNLAQPQLLAKTATSTVYTVLRDHEQVVLKILTPIGIADEATGAIALACYGGQGAVRLLRHDTGAHLLEYVGGDDLVPKVARGNDEQATIIIAQTLNKLHAAYTGTAPMGLIPLRRRFRGLFSKADADEAAGIDSIYRQAALIAQELLDHPQEERVLHGDMHHENVRYHEARGWLAFDPKGLYGERTFDAANILCNPMVLPELVKNEARLLRNARLLAEQLQIDFQRVLQYAFAYACLSAAWSLEDGYVPDIALAVANLLEPHIMP